MLVWVIRINQVHLFGLRLAKSDGYKSSSLDVCLKENLENPKDNFSLVMWPLNMICYGSDNITKHFKVCPIYNLGSC